MSRRIVAVVILVVVVDVVAVVFVVLAPGVPGHCCCGFRLSLHLLGRGFCGLDAPALLPTVCWCTANGLMMHRWCTIGLRGVGATPSLGFCS